MALALILPAYTLEFVFLYVAENCLIPTCYCFTFGFRQAGTRSWLSPMWMSWQECNVLLAVNLRAFGEGGKEKGSDSEELSTL